MNGLGACLLQNNQPMAYASRSLTPNRSSIRPNWKRNVSHRVWHGKIRKLPVWSESDSGIRSQAVKIYFQEKFTERPKAPPENDVTTPQVWARSCVQEGTTFVHGRSGNSQQAYHRGTRRNRRSNDHAWHKISNRKGDRTNWYSSKSQIREQTGADSNLKALIRIVKEGWPSTQTEVPPPLKIYSPFRDELAVQNGVILKGGRLIVQKWE